MIYAEIGSNFMQVGGECPNGWIEMQESRPSGDDTLLFTAQQDGTWAITQEDRDAVSGTLENLWRATQMPIARENVTAIEFGDETIPGTAADWKVYWLALRAWIDGAEGYPDSTRRPVGPA